MILNGGTLDGVRLVAPETVATMRINHLTPGISVHPGWNNMGITAPTAENGQGFGLGFAVRVSEGKNKIPGSVGDISWGGANGTYFWIDPKERLFAILMLQAPSPTYVPYRALMRTHVYDALRN